MTEVRRITTTTSGSGCSASGGFGLYATKEYQPGDVIVVEETPLLRLAPCSQEDDEKLRTVLLISNEGNNTKNNHQRSFWDTIDIPSDIPKEYDGTFRGLVQSALCYAASSNDDDSKTKQLLELYYPSITNPSEQEQTIVQIAKRALDYIKKNVVATKDSSSLSKLLVTDANDEDSILLLKVMLIWACNAFEGARIYNTISRMNHCCDPNAVVILANNNNDSSNNNNNNKQIVMAATSINKGEEITISYLGTFLYCDKSVRQRILQQTKHFRCQCNRCTGGCCSSSSSTTTSTAEKKTKDIAASIPCSFCHPRSSTNTNSDDNNASSTSNNINNELLLEEDVQYDDDQTVHYMCPIITTTSDSNSIDSKIVYQCESCFQKFTTTTDDKDNADTATNNIFKITNSISDKVLSFLQDQQKQSAASKSNSKPKAAVAAATKKKGADKNDGDEDVDDNDEEVEVLAEHLRGACMAYLGARHWATNLLLLLYLDTLLKEYHSELLSPQPNSEPDLERVAEFVDILERLYRFVDGLQLKIHRGHLLGHVTIGVARALVSLGDVKSQKYAKEWLDKIDNEYVQYYENDGIKKVVETLKVAWQRQQQDTGGKPQAKRLKTSG